MADKKQGGTETPSIDLCVGSLVAIALVAFPMTWWFRAVLLVMFLGVFAHVLWRSSWSQKIAWPASLAIFCCGGLLPVLLLGVPAVVQDYPLEQARPAQQADLPEQQPAGCDPRYTVNDIEVYNNGGSGVVFEGRPPCVNGVKAHDNVGNGMEYRAFPRASD